MRTTLSLDDDVALRIERLRRARRASFKQVVNDLLRRALDEGERSAQKAARPRVQIAPLDLGRCWLASVDDVAAALAVAEGDSFR